MNFLLSIFILLSLPSSNDTVINNTYSTTIIPVSHINSDTLTKATTLAKTDSTKKIKAKKKFHLGSFIFVFFSGILGIGFLSIFGIGAAFLTWWLIRRKTQDEAKKRSATIGLYTFLGIALLAIAIITFSTLYAL